MRTTAYDDGVTPWSRRNHLTVTRLTRSLLLSSDDSDNNFSRTPGRTRAEIMINQPTLRLGLPIDAYLSPPAPIPLLCKPEAHVSASKMGGDAFCPLPAHGLTFAASL
jgi:hypothetical protein